MSQIIIRTFLLFFIGLNSYADVIETSVPNERYLDKTLRQHFFMEYSLLNLSMKHKEKSSDSSFEEFGESNDIKINQLSLRYYIELNLFAGLNIFINPNISFVHGSEIQEDGGDSSNIDSDDRVSGYGGGGEVGISYSFLYESTIVQPFASVGAGKYQMWNFLRYDDDTDDARSTEISYNFQPRYDEITLGCKFVSIVNHYSSYIGLVYRNFAFDDLEGKATKGEDIEYALSSQAEAEFNHVSFKIGFGSSF